MISKVKVTLGNISFGTTQERVFESRNEAMMWINKQMVRLSGLQSVHELYFRMESYSDVPNKNFSNGLPF